MVTFRDHRARLLLEKDGKLCSSNYFAERNKNSRWLVYPDVPCFVWDVEQILDNLATLKSHAAFQNTSFCHSFIRHLGFEFFSDSPKSG